MTNNISQVMPLYEEVAQDIRKRVANGMYQPGDRVPSLRRLSSQLQVSLSTTIAAYDLLETQGILEARSQSGYYVKESILSASWVSEKSKSPHESIIPDFSDNPFKNLQPLNHRDVVQLGGGAPHLDFLPEQQLSRIGIDVMRRSSNESLLYSFPPGRIELRTQIARNLLDAGCDLNPDEIIITSGCQEAIILSLRAVAQSGDTIAVASPTYFGAMEAIKQLNMQVLEIPASEGDGISLDALELAIKSMSIKACILSPNVSNPTGSSMSDQRKQKLVSLLAENNIALIEDDSNADLCFAKSRPMAAKAFDHSGQVLLCSSFSKTVAPGLRVGWIAPGRRYQSAVERLKYANNLGVPSLPQLIIAEFNARTGYARYLRQIRKRYSEQVKCVSEAVLAQFPANTQVFHPSGGYNLWVKLPPAVDSFELYSAAMQHGISIAPGPMFSNSGGFRQFIRLNCAQPWTVKLEQAFETLGKLSRRSDSEHWNRGDEALPSPSWRQSNHSYHT